MRELFRTALVLLLSGSLVVAQAPPPAAAPAGPPVTVPGALNLQNANLLDVIDILARDLHINYILDSRVKGGTVTINTYGEIKAVDLRPILETILRMNGYSMVQVGNLFRIVPSGDAARLPISPQTNMKEFPDNEQMLLNLIFLKYMTATEMDGILKPFLGENAISVPYAPANLLMIEDNSRNMRRTTELINLFDSDQFAGQRVQLFTTQNSRPTDLVKELDTVFRAYALNEKTSAVRFLPIDRINTVLAVAANPGVFVSVADWIKKLDIPVRAPAGAVDNYFYKLKYGRAEIIGGVISQLYGQSGGTNGFSQYNQAGNRFNGTGGLAGGGTFGGAFGNNTTGGFGSGGVTPSPFGGVSTPTNSFPTANVTGTTATPQPPPNALSGAFAAPGTPGAAIGPAGTTIDQTGQYLTPGVGASGGLPRIIPNPFDNSLLVQGTPQQWAQILKLLDQLDVAPRQVLIDAKIYEVDLTDALNYGVEAYLNQIGVLPSNFTTRQLIGAAGNTGIGLTAGMLVGQSRQLLGSLSLADVKTHTKVISAPSIIATDSIAASINVGTSVPTLSAVTPGLTSGGNSLFTQSISNQSTGVSLNILARVNSSGVVTLVIDQSVTAPQPTTQSGSGSSIGSPSFSQRNVSTQVTVQDGDTIAIGGIILETNSFTKSGIPGLNHIPYIGGIFGSVNYNKARTELIIFLTPRVIYDTNQVADATEDLKDKVKSLMREVKQ